MLCIEFEQVLQVGFHILDRRLRVVLTRQHVMDAGVEEFGSVTVVRRR